MNGMRTSVILLTVTWGLQVSAGELDVARQALRDGLWAVARTHAAAVAGDAAATNAARLVTVESFVHEGRWDEVAKLLKKWGDPKEGAFAYYRAAAAGNFSEAAKILRSQGTASATAEARMLEADLLRRAGDRAGAEKAWREVTAITNAPERAFTIACANLMDPALLRRAYAAAKATDMKRLAGLRLGVALIRDKATTAEGERLIRALTKDAPDAPGAREAFLAMAETDLATGRWKEAAQTYHDAIEIWPDAARTATVQEGIGWANQKLGKHEAALEAFLLAERLAETDDQRATALMKQGDILAETDRGDEAMTRYRTVLSKYPQTAVAQKLKKIVHLREVEALGREAFKGYRFADAQKHFAEVAAEDAARRPRMDYYDVLCLYGQGLDAKAEERAKALSENCPDPEVRADVMLWLAKFCYNRSEWKRARTLFGTYAEHNGPSTDEALLWAARASFAENEYGQTVQTATRLVERSPRSPLCQEALILQGEALIELTRFDEAVLVFERVAIDEGTSAENRRRAQTMKADALFAMGADNPVRYAAALEAYRAIRFGGSLSPSGQIVISFKIARTLEKLKRMDEAIDQYYTQVVLAYREGRMNGEHYDDEARAAFSRAAFRLADEYEGRGKDFQTVRVLELVVESDVPAAPEAAKRIRQLSTKGRFQ